MRPLLGNLLKGLSLGLFVATGLSAWALLLRTQAGTAPFDRLHTTFTATVVGYYHGGTTGGLLIGLAWPLRRWLIGYALLGHSRSLSLLSLCSPRPRRRSLTKIREHSDGPPRSVLRRGGRGSMGLVRRSPSWARLVQRAQVPYLQDYRGCLGRGIVHRHTRNGTSPQVELLLAIPVNRSRRWCPFHHPLGDRCARNTALLPKSARAMILRGALPNPRMKPSARGGRVIGNWLSLSPAAAGRGLCASR